MGLLFASHAAVAFTDAQQIDRLKHGLATGDLIGQAKGMLMERHNLTADQAFRVLVEFSNDHNRPLRLDAQELSSTEDPTSSAGTTFLDGQPRATGSTPSRAARLTVFLEPSRLTPSQAGRSASAAVDRIPAFSAPKARIGR